MKEESYRIFQFCVSIFLLLLNACSPMIATQPPGMLETMVAATVNALPSSTVLPTTTSTLAPTIVRPTLTDLPTTTPLPTIPPLPTVTPLPTSTEVPMATTTASGPIIKRQGDANFACAVLSQLPANYLQASSGQDIPVAWRIRNMGERDWEKENIDIGYISGQKMAIGGTRFDLSKTIRAGDVGDIILTFEAPDKAGTYTTVWALFRGSNPFCEFSFSLVVK